MIHSRGMDSAQIFLRRLSDPRILVLLLIFATTLVYARSLQNNFVEWDDNYLIVENQTAHGISGTNLARAFTTFDPELYVPLALVSFQAEYMIAGTEPLLYHVDNLLLHIFNAILVFFLCLRLSGRRWQAFSIALLFALHPLSVEAVAWMSSRKDLLCWFFALGSLHLYLSFLQTEKRKWLWMSALLFALSLLSKVSGILLPLVLLLLDWQRQRQPSLRVFVEKAPFFLLSLVFGIIGIAGKLQVPAAPSQQIYEVTSANTAPLIDGLWEMFFLLGKFIWPHPLAILHPLSAFSPMQPSVLAALLLVSAAVAFGWYRGNIRNVLFGLGFAALFVLPSLGLSHVYLPSEKYLYLSLTGLLFSFASAFFPSPTRNRTPTQALFLIVLISLLTLTSAVLTSSRSLTWHDSSTLFQTLSATYPGLHHP